MRNIGQKLFEGLNTSIKIKNINMYQLSFSNILHRTNNFAPQFFFYNSYISCSSMCLTMHLQVLTFVLGCGFCVLVFLFCLGSLAVFFPKH